MAVPPVSARPPVKRDEPTPTAATPTSATVPPAPVTAVPTTTPVQAIYLCSAHCFESRDGVPYGNIYASSTKGVREAQDEIQSICAPRAFSDNPTRRALDFECKVYIVPPVIRLYLEPVKSEVPARGEK